MIYMLIFLIGCQTQKNSVLEKIDFTNWRPLLIPELVDPKTESDLLTNWQRTDVLLQKWQAYSYNLEVYINDFRT